MLTILSPLLILLIICLTIIYKGNPFFTQVRGGKDGRVFRILKFKTMHTPLENSDKAKSGVKRISLSGKILRRMGIDELPQLINVLKGEMNIVGPRPLPVEYIKLYNKHQYRRLEIKPGITGWSQINTTFDNSWNERLDYDVWYADHVCFLIDLRILLLTLPFVLRRKEYQSWPKFTGSN
jgi:lipopolysaccharide/colanic/teichoic acid biosynthesis glycosyltransferase